MPGRTIFSDAEWEAISLSLRLSGRKFEIVQAIFDDDTELAIAQRLGISQHTVHTHIERLYQKLDVGSRIQLVTCVVRQYVSERGDLEPLSLEWPTPQ